MIAAMGVERCFWDSEVMGSKPRRYPLSNSLIIGIYPVASAWRAYLFSSQNDIFTPPTAVASV